jgi:membrane fusion protein, multidrug efflux system
MGLSVRRLSLVAASAALLCSCARDPDKNSVPSPPPARVLAAVVRSRTVPITQDFVATTVALDSVDVRARVEGTLDAVHFKEGTVVHQGQLLFTLQQDKYQAALQAALASLAKTEADLVKAKDSQPVVQAEADLQAREADLTRANLSVKRLTPLAASKAVPQKDLDNALAGQQAAKASVLGAQAQLTNAKVGQAVGIAQANAAVMQSKSQVSDARLNLSYTTIRAPVTGLIGFLQADPGNVVGSAGTQVLDTISTIDPMEVSFAVDEVTYLKIAGNKRDPKVRALANQPLHLILADNSVYPQSGRLYAANRALDPKTGTIQVEARFPNPDAVLRPNQFARIRIVTEMRPNATLVPARAVVQTQGSAIAYVVSPDGVVQLRSLTLGPQYGNDYVVTEGLRPGERVITEGTQKVQPGAKVAVSTDTTM